jgi:hypothetical protein
LQYAERLHALKEDVFQVSDEEYSKTGANSAPTSKVLIATREVIGELFAAIVRTHFE